MVAIWEAVLLGIIQGITEWLPISSSGHLVLVQNLLGVDVPILFDLMLHLASLLVVVIVYWKSIVEIGKGLIRGESEALRMFGYLFLASIVFGLLAFFFQGFVREVYHSSSAVAISLLITGAVLLSTKFVSREQEGKLTLRRAVLIGIVQVVAILPGVSRSGMTISTGLLQGVTREKAAEFSFLLFIPAIVGASVFELVSMGGVGAVDSIGALAVGMLVCFLVGLVALRWLLGVIKQGKLHYFSWYCFVLAVVVLVL